MSSHTLITISPYLILINTAQASAIKASLHLHKFLKEELKNHYKTYIELLFKLGILAPTKTKLYKITYE